jgi:anti-sigma regulatory factor (Ser/Thr protein kinase)
MSAPVTPSTPKSRLRDASPRGLSAHDLVLLDLSLSSEDRVVPADWKAGGLMSPLVMSETERSFRFRGLPQAVGAARRALREWEHHFDPVLFYDLSLCVSELVTNRVKHGDHADDHLELAVRRDEQLVRAEIREPRQDVVMSSPEEMKGGGDWGMFIVDRVADRWGVDHSAGTLVWCEIDIAPDGRSRAAL